ncbi:glycosyltransferase [Candidatus Saccharibacteria bacterium]|nr:glycosyltransferase [Candidatus Saccharibacteria bacterium]
MKDLVTVILPVYNVEKYLEKCIESVLKQTYKNLEIILVDDGATDSSGRMCDEFAKKDKRIKVVHKKNGGLNMARKSGFEVSTGDWITFVDSDDVIDKNYVEYLLEGAKRHNTEMSMCGFQYFVDTYERDGKDISTYSKSLKSTIKMYLLDGRPSEDFFMQTAWGKLFSRRLVSRIDWDFSNYKINEDEFMSMMYYSDLKTPLAVVDNRLIYYRQRPDSIMGQVEKEYVNLYKGKKLTKFEYLAEVYDKRLEKFGQKYKDEIAYWFGLHYIINLSKVYGRNKKPLTAGDKKVFNDRLPDIINASKKHRYWNEHEAIMNEMKRVGSIDGFFGYKKNSPSVSIIVPIYNTERFLGHCLDSIINQTYFNLDIILINDGSTDRSAEICDLYAKRDYRVRLVSQENSGVSSARNKGLDIATGEYVMFVDSDDFLEPFAVQELIRVASKDSRKSDIYIGGIYDYHTAGYKFSYQPHSLPLHRTFDPMEDPENSIYQIMTKVNSPFAKLYNREFIEANKLRFDEKIRICEDTLFVFQASILAKGLYITDVPVYFYRNDLINDYSAMGTVSDSKALDFAKALEGMYTALGKKIVKSEGVSRGFRKGAVAHALYNLEIVEKNSSAHKKVFEYISQELIKKYILSADDADNEGSKKQLELIIDGSYEAYTLSKLNSYKNRLYTMIDETEVARQLLGTGSANISRAIVRKVAPYIPARHKRFVKKMVRRAHREITRLKKR